MGIIFSIVTTLASVSPLLTFSALYQQKDWRRDRIVDHLRTEGVWRQLFGIIRPMIILDCGIIALWIPESWPGLPIVLLLALTMVQIGSRRQRTPKWTQKAKLVALIGLCINGVLAIYLSPIYLPVLLIIQPAILSLILLLLLPLDRLLKARVHHAAETLRSHHPNLLVIGITGSVGKTTTKELLLALLKEEGAVATPAYVNSDMGVATWLKNILTNPPREWINRDRPIAIVEMGAYRKGEIALLCKIAKPQIGVLTAVGLQHVGLFGSPEILAASKGELIDALPPDGHAVINTTSPPCREIAKRSPCPVTTVKSEEVKVAEEESGIALTIEGTKLTTHLSGAHNTTNLLLAISVAKYLGVEMDAIAERLRSFRPPEHTFSVEQKDGITVLNDTHNASPESFSGALSWAAEREEHPIVLLTDGIIELGPLTDRIHTELGVKSSTFIDRAIFLSPKRATSFQKGYGREIELFSKHSTPLPPGSLLLCIGRIPPSVITKLTTC